jgi:hypothetical protein
MGMYVVRTIVAAGPQLQQHPSASTQVQDRITNQATPTCNCVIAHIQMGCLERVAADGPCAVERLSALQLSAFLLSIPTAVLDVEVKRS